jgi:hypothetical protein
MERIPNPNWSYPKLRFVEEMTRALSLYGIPQSEPEAWRNGDDPSVTVIIPLPFPTTIPALHAATKSIKVPWMPWVHNGRLVFRFVVKP